VTGPVDFTFNDESVSVEAAEDELLLDTVRDRLDATSVRYSCGIGVCGSCTVLVDGRAVSSCLQMTSMVDGRSVQTAESVLGEGDATGASVLDAFVDHQAYQCSYCIPAMALTVASLLRDRPRLTVEEIREELAGNLCRCGSYPQVLEAVSTLVKEKANPS
jgi:aerobic-type carbon monoxide dehydrogenase small subunit (CoxS/CutS family)